MYNKLKCPAFTVAVLCLILLPKISLAYPVFAQTAYEKPREATGRIVCANCHLAQKPVKIKVPQSIFPDTVFETVIDIPYDASIKQLTADGKKGPLNVGAILILPEGFKLAPRNRLSDEVASKSDGIFIQPYSVKQENILIVGPLAGEKNRQVSLPILAPDPAQNKNVHFLNYPIFVGGNRGRGQIYPNGQKTNNTSVLSPATGQITSIKLDDKGASTVVISSNSSGQIAQTISAGQEILVKENDIVVEDQALTLDPNVGGFGQSETEIILQEPKRVKGMIIFFLTVMSAQFLLVVKKKQIENIQNAEINF